MTLAARPLHRQPAEDILREGPPFSGGSLSQLRYSPGPPGAHGGALVARLLDDHTLKRLTEEAWACHPQAVEQRVQRADDAAALRGDPNRWLENAPGGPVLQAFYGSSTVLATLAGLTGLRWRTAGGLGTFSYYRRQGHHLGLHRDLDICELAVITCIYDDSPAGGIWGALRLYPSRSHDGLRAIVADPRGGVDVHLRSGDSLILLGGLVPHRLLPVRAGHVRVVTPLCYQVENGR